MPEYVSPGVFVEEAPARARPIDGVGTSTAAFVGAAASPGTVLAGTLRSRIWTTGLPVSRSKMNTMPLFVAWITAINLLYLLAQILERTIAFAAFSLMLALS